MKTVFLTIFSPVKIHPKIFRVIEESGKPFLEMIKQDLKTSLGKNLQIPLLDQLKLSEKISMREGFRARRIREEKLQEKIVIAEDKKLIMHARRSTITNGISVTLVGLKETILNSFIKSFDQKIRKISKEIEIRFISLRALFKLARLDSLKVTKGTKLLDRISESTIKFIVGGVGIKKIKEMKKFPMILTPDNKKFWIKNLVLRRDLIKHGFFEENYGLHCSKCKKVASVQTNLGMAKKSLKTGICSQCGRRFSKIVSVYKFTNLGKSCLIGGDWLEVFVKFLLIHHGVNPKHIRIHRLYEGKELDVVFFYSGILGLIECKDTKIGTNDIDLLVLSKAPKIEPDKVAAISTHVIQKNVKRYAKELEIEQEFSLEVIDPFKNIKNRVEKLLARMREERKIDDAGVIERISDTLLRYLDGLSISARRERPIPRRFLRRELR